MYLIDHETVALIAVPIIVIFITLSILNAKKSGVLSKEILTKKLVIGVFALYMTFVVMITLFPIIVPPETPDSGFKILNLSFSDVVMMWRYSKRAACINIVGNIALFIPFASLGKCIGYKPFASLPKFMATVILFILAIEAAQYIETATGLAAIPRTVDIVDIVCNMIGAVIGWFAYYIACKNVRI